MLYLIIPTLVFITDQKLKNRIEVKYQEQDHNIIWGNRIIVTKYHNYGAFLNAGQKAPGLIKMISSSILLFLAVSYVLLLFQKGGTVMKTSLSFLLGGALSNVWDRITRGYVIDYFSFNYVKLKKIVFNLADMFIFAGSILILIHEIKRK